MFEVMKNRRSIRRYAEKEIPESLLNELLEVAQRVSNTGNMQLYSVIITRDQAGKERLAPIHFNQPMITSAPVVLTFCVDANRFTKWAGQRGAVAGFDNLETFLTAAIDTSLLAQGFCAAAEERGLGICYIGTTTYNADQLIDALHLPRLVMPLATVTVGYPATPLPEQPERLPLQAIVHQEEYADYTPEAIDTYYAETEALASNQQFVKENNKKTLAQVFTDVRYTKANNEHFSEVLLNTLWRQGFIHSAKPGQ